MLQKAFMAGTPVALVVWFLVSTYAVFFGWGVTFIISTLTRDTTGSITSPVSSSTVDTVAVVLIAIYLFVLFLVKALCVLSLAWAHWLAWRGTWPGLKQTTPKRVMHSSAEERYQMQRTARPTNARLRRCGFPGCDDRNGYGDRVYHSEAKDTHFVLHDHYCWWLRLPVHLETIKGYVLFLAYLIFDVVLSSFGLIVAAATLGKNLAWVYLGIACVSWVVLFLGWLLGARPAIDLTWSNLTSKEAEIWEWTLAEVEQMAGGAQGVRFVTFKVDKGDALRHPWDLGHWENVRQALGDHVWEWFLPFRQPRRVRHYGRYRGNVSDLPLGEMWWAYHRNPEASRANRSDLFVLPPGLVTLDSRRAARSSGSSSAIELQ